jgi:hypothetical protein
MIGPLAAFTGADLTSYPGGMSFLGENGCNQPHPHHRPGRSSRLIGAPGSPPDENREF